MLKNLSEKSTFPPPEKNILTLLVWSHHWREHNSSYFSVGLLARHGFGGTLGVGGVLLSSPLAAVQSVLFHTPLPPKTAGRQHRLQLPSLSLALLSSLGPDTERPTGPTPVFFPSPTSQTCSVVLCTKLNKSVLPLLYSFWRKKIHVKSFVKETASVSVTKIQNCQL